MLRLTSILLILSTLSGGFFSQKTFADSDEAYVSVRQASVNTCAGLIRILTPGEEKQANLARISDDHIENPRKSLSPADVQFLLDFFYDDQTDREAFVELALVLKVGHRLALKDVVGEFETLWQKRTGRQESGVVEESSNQNATRKSRWKSFLSRPRLIDIILTVYFSSWGFLAVEHYLSKPVTDYLTAITPIVVVDSILHEMDVNMLRQKFLKDSLFQISSAREFPDEIALSSIAVEQEVFSEDFVTFKKLSENVSRPAYQTATYSLREFHPEVFDLGLETLEISVYENFQGTGKRIMLELGDIGGAIKAVYYYTPEKGIWQAPYPDADF